MSKKLSEIILHNRIQIRVSESYDLLGKLPLSI